MCSRCRRAPLLVSCHFSGHPVTAARSPTPGEPQMSSRPGARAAWRPGCGRPDGSPRRGWGRFPQVSRIRLPVGWGPGVPPAPTRGRGKSNTAPTASTTTVPALGTCDLLPLGNHFPFLFSFLFFPRRGDHLPSAQHQPSARAAAPPRLVGMAPRGPGTRDQQGAFGTQGPYPRVRRGVACPHRGRDLGPGSAHGVWLQGSHSPGAGLGGRRGAASPLRGLPTASASRHPQSPQRVPGVPLQIRAGTPTSASPLRLAGSRRCHGPG